MEQEDNEFFVLVLGVLAAIVVIVSWWYTTGGVLVSTDPPVIAPTATITAGNTTATIDPDPTDPEVPDTAVTADESDEANGSTNPTEPAPTAEPTPAVPDRPAAASVFDALAEDDQLTVITGLFRDAELDDALARGGPYTVFAPNNDAINRAAESDSTVSILAGDPESVLNYHLVADTYSIEQLEALALGSRSPALTTVLGEPLDITIVGDRVVINGTALVDRDARPAENGVVHVLDNVLIPPVAALNSLVALEPIVFSPGSATIEPSSFPTLDELIEVLSTSSVRITIEGHTDSSGDPLLNQNLSQARARAVVNHLVANGVDESRLTAEGFGASRPVGDNATEEGRALNRRIEFSPA